MGMRSIVVQSISYETITQLVSPITQLVSVFQRNFYAAFAGLGHSWSPSTSKRRYHIMYKAVQNWTHLTFPASVTLAQRSNRSNHPHKFRHIFARTNAYKFSFFPLVIPLWNGLPNCAVNTESVTDFQANALPSIRQYCNAMWIFICCK